MNKVWVLKLNMNTSDYLDYYEYIFDSADAASAFRTGYTSKNWPLFHFENPLQDVVAVKIVEVNIPMTFYTVNSTNNTFVVNDLTVPNSWTVTVPPGNYDSGTLTTALHTALHADTTLAWTVTFDVSTLKFTFTPAPAHNITFEFGTAPNTGETNMRLIMGFNAGTSASGTVLTSPNVPQITGPDYFYVNSDSFGTYLNLYLPQTGSRAHGGEGSEMAHVPNTATYSELLAWKDPTPQYFFTTSGCNALQTIDMYITGGVFENPLDFNGLSFSVKLGILQRKSSKNNQYLGVKRMRAI